MRSKMKWLFAGCRKEDMYQQKLATSLAGVHDRSELWILIAAYLLALSENFAHV